MRATKMFKIRRSDKMNRKNISEEYKMKLSEEINIPVDGVTETYAILGKRGVGKTHTAVVEAEEMLKAGLHILIVDPLGVWWGLRSLADGLNPGFDIAIFGGEHGDRELKVSDARSVAKWLVQEKKSLIFDLSLMRKDDQIKFMTAFCEEL